MASLINTDQNGISRKVVWFLLAISINALELALPRLPFLPWLKPGFANVITILWITRYGFTDALLYSILRVWISGFYFGFSLLTLALGLSGGILATTAMSLLWKLLGKKHIGTIGLGIAGALFHNIGQLLVVYVAMARNTRIFYQLPFMLGAALVFGAIVGGVAPHIGKLLEKATQKQENGLQFTRKRKKTTVADRVICGFMFLLSISLMFVDHLAILSSAAISLSLIGWVLNNRNIKSLFYPIRFSLIFIFIGFMHLFFSYGVRLELFPAITREGLLLTAAQWLRLWTWLQATHVFRKFHFDGLIMETLERLFPKKGATLEAGILALEYFPKTIQNARMQKKVPLKTLLLKPRETVESFVENMYVKIDSILGREKELKAPKHLTESPAE
ncbi:MAG: Gx transporter family protein [Chitinispirillaceae bacterium]